jgi:hypothetical protein
MAGTGEGNQQTCQKTQEENGKLMFVSRTGENECEEKRWNR